VIERFKLPDEGRMQVNFSVEDPSAFNAPWSGIVLYQHAHAAARLFEEPCAEETAAGFGQHFPVPVAKRPDF